VAESSDHKFTPAWWLRGPHPQTLWAQVFRRNRSPALQRERIQTPDRDRLDLYHMNVDRQRPRLILLHGLEGSVRSHYIGGLVTQAARRRWNVTVLEFRGCGTDLNLAQRMYHSGETTDLGFVVDLMISRNPSTHLFLAGISLGGNVLLKWLGECAEGAPRQVAAAGTISVPYDLEAGCRVLQRGFARVYDRHFLRSLRAKAFRKLGQHPGLFDAARLARARTIEDFDDCVTAVVHGFDGSHDYYVRSSSISRIADIRVPTLLISAADDPFLPSAVLDRVREVARTNPRLHLHFTSAGGHVGFVAGATPFRPVYWAEERLMSFLDSIELSNPPQAIDGRPAAPTDVSEQVR
jgi:uncharacterized protein